MKYKYDVFISYSSKDCDAVKRLSKVLIKKGFNVWLDEWEIQVGDSLVQKISEGIESSRYLALWLSKHSVESRWAKIEWQAKFYDEVDSDSTIILPLLAGKCEIPLLLKGKKYADFTKSFDEGVDKLLEVIEPNCTMVIDKCIKNLIDGIEPSDSAEKLGQIIIRSKDEAAFNGLWEASIRTKKPLTTIDHIVYYFSKVLIETDDLSLKEAGYNILMESASHESEVVVDKFAYAAADIALDSNDHVFRNKVIKLISYNYEKGSEVAREKYGIERRRMLEVNETVFD